MGGGGTRPQGRIGRHSPQKAEPAHSASAPSEGVGSARLRNGVEQRMRRGRSAPAVKRREHLALCRRSKRSGCASLRGGTESGSGGRLRSGAAFGVAERSSGPPSQEVQYRWAGGWRGGFVAPSSVVRYRYEHLTQTSKNGIYTASFPLMLRRLDRRQTAPNPWTATRSFLGLKWAYLNFKIGLWIAGKGRISLK